MAHDGPVARRRELLILAGVLGATLGLALWTRLPAAPHASVGSDSLGSYLAAWAASSGHLPRPPNPEGGHSLWLLALPLVHLADSLEGLFRWRFALGALAAPLASAAAWLLAAGQGSTRAAVAALVAGAAVALDVGLVDTLLSAFRGYGGPEHVGLATLGLALALRGHGWGAALGVAALVGAAGQHPLAFGVALGALAALPGVWARVGRGPVLAAVAVGLLCALPRLVWLWTLSECDAGGALTCLGQVAGGSAEAEAATADLVWRALHDRTAVDLGWAAVGLGLGLGAALLPGAGRAPTPAWLFLVGGFVGIGLLGLSLATLRPYHLRHLAVPVAVLAGVGWARLGPLGLLALVPLWLGWDAGRAVGSAPRAVAVHDALAARLGEETVRVETLHPGRPGSVEASGVVLSAVLRGVPAERFAVGPQVPVVVVLGEGEARALVPAGVGRVIGEAGGAELRRFEDLAAARRALCPVLPEGAWVGGAYDWRVALAPTRPGEGLSPWTCP